MNGIKIFSENYVNKNCAFTFSSGSETQDKLYDQNQKTQWMSYGSYNGKIEIIEIEFRNWQSQIVERTIDKIILLNHNIKHGTMEYWGGSAWNAWTVGTLIFNDKVDNILSVEKITTSKIRFKPTTITADIGEKAVGELKACCSILEPSNWLTEFKRKDYDNSGNYRLAKGSLVSWKEWNKVEGTLDIKNISLDEMRILKEYSNKNITIVFYDDFDLKETFEFVITNPIRYIFDRKTKFYETSLELKEI